MASGAKEEMGESSYDESHGSLIQPPQAELLEAAEDSQCPICLGHMKNPAYAIYCMHKFCFQCIQQWAKGRDNCLVNLLNSMRGDGHYKEHEVSLYAHLQRMAMQWGFQPPPLAGRRGPLDTESVQRQEDVPGPSNASSQQAPASSASDEPVPLRAGECLAGPAAPLDPHNSTE
ncbi:hypothetical protein WISP_76398 [Willisornis vidua]|uniref:RING-type E3 ubiquitin transferase n=1 Tax=Willisornis vidua TaxID=1566151 RepID=A0ABQ9DBW8_9PASS|nr:hypothetical protein WISP_76398 [Willisornis vidua]